MNAKLTKTQQAIVDKMNKGGILVQDKFTLTSFIYMPNVDEPTRVSSATVAALVTKTAIEDTGIRRLGSLIQYRVK